jgi:starch-binding outer membrane protein, SusD/RagB family
MKMNPLKIFLVTLFLGLLIGSCEKFTTPGNDNQYTVERMLKDPSFAEGLLMAVYQSLPNAYNLEEVATDDAVSNYKLNGYLRMATGEWTASYSPISKWNNAYKAIFNLNYFLSIINNVQWYSIDPVSNNSFIKRFKGEALALRGYFYQQLLVNHGGIASNNNLLGVPLVTEVLESDGNWKVPRSTYQDCINRINTDYDSAIVLLPAVWADISGNVVYNRVYGKQNVNRINGTCVKALKARLALHVASPAFNSGSYNATKCIAAASIAGPLLVAKEGIDDLSDNVLFYDSDDDISNTDILWRNDHYQSNSLELQNAPPSLYGNGNVNPTQNLVDAFPMKNGYPINNALSNYDPASPYTGRDPRLESYILCNGNNYGSTPINTDLNSPINGLNKKTTSTRTGYYLLKLVRTDVNLNPASITTQRHFYTHIRWTEIYLNYAEAANEAWGPDGDPNGYGFTARTIIGKIRNLADIDQPDNYLASLTTKEELRALIRNERRLALCFEGFRFWDLRRWGSDLTEKAKGVSINEGTYTPIDVENRVYPAYAIYGPIPYNEVVKYPELLQNTGW